MFMIFPFCSGVLLSPPKEFPITLPPWLGLPSPYGNSGPNMIDPTNFSPTSTYREFLLSKGSLFFNNRMIPSSAWSVVILYDVTDASISEVINCRLSFIAGPFLIVHWFSWLDPSDCVSIRVSTSQTRFCCPSPWCTIDSFITPSSSKIDFSFPNEPTCGLLFTCLLRMRNIGLRVPHFNFSFA